MSFRKVVQQVQSEVSENLKHKLSDITYHIFKNFLVSSPIVLGGLSHTIFGLDQSSVPEVLQGSQEGAAWPMLSAG